MASVVVALKLCCSSVCGIFLDQGSNTCPLHWQADSYPLSHQRCLKINCFRKWKLRRNSSYGISEKEGQSIHSMKLKIWYFWLPVYLYRLLQWFSHPNILVSSQGQERPAGKFPQGPIHIPVPQAIDEGVQHRDDYGVPHWGNCLLWEGGGEGRAEIYS